MRANIDVRRVVLLLVLGSVVVTAGCTGSSGTKSYTGTKASAGDVHIQSAKVVDGTLRQLTITNNGSSAVSAGTWKIKLDGTSNKKSATYNMTVNAGSISAGGSKQITIEKGSQPDWQDGAKLTIRTTPPKRNQAIALSIRPQ